MDSIEETGAERISNPPTRAMVADWIDSIVSVVRRSRDLLDESAKAAFDSKMLQAIPSESRSLHPEWTRKKPMEAGTYWIWSKRIGFSQLCFVMTSPTGAGLFISTIGGSIVKMPESGDELFPGQWICGPIYDPRDTPPEE